MHLNSENRLFIIHSLKRVQDAKIQSETFNISYTLQTNVQQLHVWK